MTVDVIPTHKLQVIFALIERQWGISFMPDGDFKLFYDRTLGRDETPASLCMENEDTICVVREQCGGKPVIYLSAPSELEARVTLSLIPEWNLSAVYPVVPMTCRSSNSSEQIRGNIRTHSDGNLTETNTVLDVSYLFWEAQ